MPRSTIRIPGAARFERPEQRADSDEESGTSSSEEAVSSYM